MTTVNALATVKDVRVRRSGDVTAGVLVELDWGYGVSLVARFVGDIAEAALELEQGDQIWVSGLRKMRRADNGREYILVDVNGWAHVVSRLNGGSPYPGLLP